MPSVINVGGSLTGAIFITIAAWGIRSFRAAQHKRREREEAQALKTTRVGRFFAPLSPAAVRMLVETEPIPHYLIDVRSAEEAAAIPLPSVLANALPLPHDRVADALRDSACWRAHFGDRPAYPTPQHLLLFVCSVEEEMIHAARAAAAAGFQRSAILYGGLQAFESLNSGTHLRYINRDAVAFLMAHRARAAAGRTSPFHLSPRPESPHWEHRDPRDHALRHGGYLEPFPTGAAGGQGSGAGLPPPPPPPPPPPKVFLIDLRRHDERTLYGAIPASVHLPVDQLAAALALPPPDFERQHHWRKPATGDVLLMHCRTGRRAAWAAQMCLDAGFERVYVYRQGTYGWRLDSCVKPYKAYDVWDVPPEAEPFQPEIPDEEGALAELTQLGLMTTSMLGY